MPLWSRRHTGLSLAAGVSHFCAHSVKMSWLLAYNRNYFLCNYQTYPHTNESIPQ
eukprot:COSAG01_NODE_28262_length_665_cov_1.146643_2_plen_54_part_01